MRRLLLALPFALLPMATIQANEHGHHHEHDQAHGSLGAHEHGVASLNLVLDGQLLELQLESPAMNLVGFEHAAKSAADKAKVAAARSQLQNPQALFGLNAGDCSLSETELESPLFEDDEHEHEGHHGDETHGEHSEIHAHYQLDCKKPDELKQLNLAELFERFPTTTKIQVQLIGPSGQQGAELTPAQPRLSF
ncbi:DUF2796 domain-containing protein [Pseudomonas benzenivorans]|uniref:DUF2796 domain-containing protein n=1 Tax=Pseudomonas benzenivorans TaxID=556533 RepID=A0ABZ0PV15_9PSED|nr:DUF2796 domain-containing protein [Pseudomonas benzenivorans]WPC04586.1 DUF2796 domain-containing protein [Pseudomonas benzenivorans]